MGKFIKKSVIIEAEQWWPNHDVEGVELYYPPDAIIGGKGHGTQVFKQDPYYAINTLEGMMRVNGGDWIITGIQGEKYPCKPDIFEATYDPVPQQKDK